MTIDCLVVTVVVDCRVYVACVRGLEWCRSV